MTLNLTWLWRGLGVFLGLAIIWGFYELSPERQINRSFDRFLSAASHRNWPKVGEFVADNYHDQWGGDRKKALDLAKQAFQNYLTLEFEASRRTLARQGDLAIVSAHIQILGRGNAIGEVITGEVNRLSGEFQFAWKRQSWKPWDWKLESIAQPELNFDPSTLSDS